MYAISPHDITKILKIVPVIEYTIQKPPAGKIYIFASIKFCVDRDAVQIPEWLTWTLAQSRNSVTRVSREGTKVVYSGLTDSKLLTAGIDVFNPSPSRNRVSIHKFFLAHPCNHATWERLISLGTECTRAILRVCQYLRPGQKRQRYVQRATYLRKTFL